MSASTRPADRSACRRSGDRARQLLAGPFAGRLLGDLGAEVIKVEPPGKPDPIREWGRARYEGRSLWWPVLSRNKKCITLNLRERARPGAPARARRARPTSSSRTSARDAGALEHRPRAAREANPRLILARVSGYGQTGPYAERAGLRLRRRGDGRAAPHQRLPRRAAAAPRHLAGRLAGRDVRRAGHPRRAVRARRARQRPRPGRRRLDPRVVLRAAREHRARVRPARHRARAGGHLAEGHRAVEHLPLARRQVGGHRRQRGQRLPPAVRGDGPARARRRRALRDPPRARRAPGRARRRSSPSGRPEHDAAEIDRMLNEAGVVSGPVYTIADIFEDPHFQARDMLVEHHDPEFGPFSGPGSCRSSRETPGSVRWSGTWEVGSHNAEVFGELLGVRRRARRAKADGSCDASPSARSLRATGCRTTPPRSSRPSAPSSSPARRRRAAAHRGGRSSTRSACRRWRARRRSSRRSTGGRATLRGPRPQRARLRPPAPRPASTRCTSPSRSPRPTTSEPGRGDRRIARGRGAHRRARARRRAARR